MKMSTKTNIYRKSRNSIMAIENIIKTKRASQTPIYKEERKEMKDTLFHTRGRAGGGGGGAGGFFKRGK